MTDLIEHRTEQVVLCLTCKTKSCNLLSRPKRWNNVVQLQRLDVDMSSVEKT